VIVSAAHDAEARKAPSLRIGVVGFGHRAELARNVAESSVDAAVTAIADTTELGRTRGSEAFPDAAVFSSHQELIAADSVDAVILATPDWTHADIAVDLLRAGIAVYLEKPIAITIEDADRVLAAAWESRTKLYVGHNMRHMPVVTIMRDLIRQGAIGEVRAVWCRHFVGNGGDYYFKDWHAERSKVTSLLLQKGAHDIDVIHWLADAYTTQVTAMGDLAVYDRVTDRADNSGRMMHDWFSFDNWPPLEQTELNPVIDVEDISMMTMRLDNGVLASYQQCHFTPDYWRNYTVIGTEGRIENHGDSEGGEVKVWNRRTDYDPDGDIRIRIPAGTGGHGGADVRTVDEFLRFVHDDAPTSTSPLAARNSVAAGVAAAASLRSGAMPQDIPAVPDEIRTYFEQGQPGSAATESAVADPTVTERA
jgi:predicted dehydrogenase